MKKRRHLLVGIASTLLATGTLWLSTLASVVPAYDVNGDGSITMADVVRLNIFIAEMPSEEKIVATDLNDDGLVTNADTVLLLKYLAEQEKATTETTTTTTETITTSTATTTTTSESTTSSTPVTETTTSATTTSTTETETTTSATTTTATTTSTQETTTTTVDENAHIELVQSLLVEMSAQEDIPALNDDTYTQGDGVWFFEYEGTIYAYTRLTKQADAPNCFDVFPYYVDAFHIWEYHGDTQVSFEVPVDDDLEFEYKGETYGYTLVDEPDAGNVKSLANRIVKNNWNWSDIQRYDYDLDAQITLDDLRTTIMLAGNDVVDFKRSTADWIDYMNDVLYCSLTNEMISNNFVLHFYSNFTTYSFACPPYSFDELAAYTGFLQVMPADYYDVFTEEFGAPCTDGGEFILYNMVDGWTTWTEETDIAWSYINPVDDQGNYLAERYDDPNLDF